MKILFIGAGAMATALIGGLVGSGRAAAGIRVIDPDTGQRMRLCARFPETRVAAKPENVLFDGLDAMVLAVKPQQLQAAARELAPFVHEHRVPMTLSIAAGIRVADIIRWLGDYPYVIRAMPNTPALVGAGMTALYAAPAANETARACAHELFSCVGDVFWLIREEMMDAMTALSGSGPAYVFYFLESLQAVGQSLGLTDKEARHVALSVLAGGLKLAQQSVTPFAELRAEVTSKGGTTEQAVQTLEAAGARQIVHDAVTAAWRRAVALGQALGEDHETGDDGGAGAER